MRHLSGLGIKTFPVFQRNCSWASHVSTVTTPSSRPKLQITNFSLIAEIIFILVVHVSEIINYVTFGDFKIFILKSLKTLKKWEYLHSSWIFLITFSGYIFPNQGTDAVFLTKSYISCRMNMFPYAIAEV